MRSRAYAKINLSLDIINERLDGYHELDSIMVPITLWDVLDIKKAKKTNFTCNMPIPINETNTVVKAINYMKNTYSIKDEFEVLIQKRIPTQAGLGGGSSDGATTIKLLNNMYSLNMNDKEIIEACKAVGSDVLFTYYNRPARIRGIGEKIDFVNIRNKKQVLIVKPKAGVSTKLAYKELNMNTCVHPDVNELERRLNNGEEYNDILGNSLEEPSLRLCPIIDEIKKDIKDLGLEYPLMSGSGSTVFVLSDDYNKLLEARDILRHKYVFVYVCEFIC